MSNTKHTTGSAMGTALAGLFLGMGILGCGYFAATAFKEVKLANQTLTVKGFAEKDVVSDYAKWSASFNTSALTQKEAYEKIEAQKQKVSDYLEAHGLKGKSFSYGGVYLSPSYKLNEKGYSTNVIEKYNARLSVYFESTDVDLVSKIAKESEGLIREGISFESNAPQYLFNKLDEVKIQLLGEAARDAKERASELSSQVGGKIGMLRDAKQGVFQITSRNDTSTSGYGMYDTSSVNKSVKAVVTMSFAASN